jgi:hypothetical protein
MYDITQTATADGGQLAELCNITHMLSMPARTYIHAQNPTHSGAVLNFAHAHTAHARGQGPTNLPAHALVGPPRPPTRQRAPPSKCSDCLSLQPFLHMHARDAATPAMFVVLMQEYSSFGKQKARLSGGKSQSRAHRLSTGFEHTQVAANDA